MKITISVEPLQLSLLCHQVVYFEGSLHNGSIYSIIQQQIEPFHCYSSNYS